MRILVYTCVFGGYDRVFPPVRSEAGVDYVVITDDAALRVEGWRTEFVDKSVFRTAKAPNRHFKMLAHRQPLPGYDVSVYVDGNVRVLGPVSDLVATFLASGAAMGVYRHPLRHSVAEEVDACIRVGKVQEAEIIRGELADYVADGFTDQEGLIETTILIKNHAHPALDPAMALWWSLFERYDTRDQVCLPYVQWKTGLPCYYHPRSFREPNPWFGIYPHVGARHIPARYTYVCARAYDSLLHRLWLRAWHAKWSVQRRLRRLLGGSR